MAKPKIKVIILANETPDDHIPWINACEAYSERIEYSVVNLTEDSWLENIQNSPFEILLARPGGITSIFKQLYDERIYILEKVLKYKIYPSADEVFLYENKRFLSFWLMACGIPHPKTNVFYNKQQALDFITKRKLPLVCKSNIGASGSGVIILRNLDTAVDYIRKAFSKEGAPMRTGPNFEKGGILIRGLHYLKHPKDIVPKLKLYNIKRSNPQVGFVIFQEYIHHEFEWRVVRIGNSFFAHKKIKSGDKASGMLIKSYENPPLKLLDFVKQITDKYGFHSQAVDLFETEEGYLVNEMQCIFGQSDPFQMLVDNVPGRYLKNHEWVFERGDFNANQSYNLRIDWIINTTQKF